jgi:hypothetical protein
MRSAPSFESLGPRIPVILATVAGLAATLFIGSAIGQSDFIHVYLLFVSIGAIVAVLTLGARYWMLIPIAFSFDIPAIPFFQRAFDLSELAILLCAVVFVCRYALHPRGITLFRMPHAAVMLYTAWACFIFFLHPVGLSGMGSSMGGARFYFKIALGLLALLILANQKITEGDAKWLIRLLIIGSVANMVVELVRYALLGSLAVAAEPNAETYYTWHQALSSPAYWIMLYLVSRYKVREVVGFSKPWVIPVALFCIALAAVSGKRAGFASVLLLPLIAALIRKEYSYVIIGGIFAAILITFLTLGHGEWFKLPLQAQRSLSYFPGNWDWEIRSEFQNGIDPFRSRMRELAWDRIKESPVVGKGYSVGRQEVIYAGFLYGTETVAQNLAAGSSWHNTWLGIWADFGFPAVLFWAVFWIQAVVIGFRVYRRTVHRSYERTLAMMLLLSFILSILRSWTGGHSANDAFSSWWTFGLLVAMMCQLQSEVTSRPVKEVSRQPAPVSARIPQPHRVQGNGR